MGTLSVIDSGFSLHAATTVSGDDVEGREALCKYVLRPPIAQERLELREGGLVRIKLRRPFRDGTVAIDLDPLSLLCRLAAAVPPPRFHIVRYAGVLASNHKLRPLVVPPPPAEDPTRPTHAHDDRERPATHRCRPIPSAHLLMRTFKIDVETCHCGGRLKLRALVIAAASIEKILRHLGEPTEPPPLEPARGPPYLRSPALRRKLGELEGRRGAQGEMFEG